MTVKIMEFDVAFVRSCWFSIFEKRRGKTQSGFHSFICFGYWKNEYSSIRKVIDITFCYMFVWVTRNNIARLLLFCLVFFGFAERFLFENFSILTELLLVKLS